MNLSTFIETGKIPASARDRACLLDAARSEILTNKTHIMSKPIKRKLPILDALAVFYQKHGRSPEGEELLALHQTAKPTAAAPSRTAPPTTPAVVQPPPPAHQGETMMGRKLRLSRESCATASKAEAVKHQPTPGKVLTKSAFDLLTASAKMEFFRDGGKLA